MKFGRIPAARAAGAILAHAQKAGGKTFKKGRVLSADDIAALETAGDLGVKLGFVENADWQLANGLSVLAAAEVLVLVDISMNQVNYFSLVDILLQ